jgi:hypothetical protein
MVAPEGRNPQFSDILLLANTGHSNGAQRQIYPVQSLHGHILNRLTPRGHDDWPDKRATRTMIQPRATGRRVSGAIKIPPVKRREIEALVRGHEVEDSLRAVGFMAVNADTIILFYRAPHTFTETLRSQFYSGREGNVAVAQYLRISEGVRDGGSTRR